MDLLPINIGDTGEVAKNKINNSYNKMVEEVREQQPSIRDGFWYIGDINTGIKAQGPQGNPGIPGEDGEPGEKGDTGNGIASIVATKNGKITTLTLTYTDGNKEYFQISDGQDGLPGTPGTPGKDGEDGQDGKPGKDGEDGKPGTNGIDGNGITSVVSSKSGKTTTVTMNFTRGIPTTFQVQDGADGQPGPKGEDGSDYIITEEDYQEIADRVEHPYFSLIEGTDYTVEYDATKGVSPFNTSYGYTNVTITKPGVERIEGAFYFFAVNEYPGTSTYRNVRVRIGEDGERIGLGSPSSVSAGYAYFQKAYAGTFIYNKKYYNTGALHSAFYDANTTYAYLVNTVVATQFLIDENGYGARYSLTFPTTPLGVETQKRSALKSASNTGAKAYNTNIEKFYVDRIPLYNLSANVAKGAVSANAFYQAYTTHDIRYTGNCGSVNVNPNRRLFLHLINFDESDYSFNMKGTTSLTNIIYSDDKIPGVFTSGDTYFYYLGYNTANRYTCQPDFMANIRIYKYSASTGTFTPIL